MRPLKHDAGDWRGLNSPGQEPRYRTIAEMLRRFGCADNVLDVGCGEGLLRGWLPHNALYTGIEPASAAALTARKHHAGARIINISAEEFSPPTSRFAAVVFSEMLYYARDPVGLLRKYARAASPSGAVVCSVYQKAEHPSLKRRLWHWLDRRRPLSNRHCEQMVRAFMARSRWAILDDRIVSMPETSLHWHIWLAAPHQRPAPMEPTPNS